MVKGRAAPTIIPGTRYGHLVTTGVYVKSYIVDNKLIASKIECKCDCGSISYKDFKAVKDGVIKCCGYSCIYSVRIKHNLSQDTDKKRLKEYNTWHNLRSKCDNSNNIYYKNYGGKGISYSKEFETIESFIEHFGYAPSKDHKFIRIDKKGNFEPGNVKWFCARRRRPS